MIKRNYISVLIVTLLSNLVLTSPLINIHSDHFQINPDIDFSSNGFTNEDEECCIDNFDSSLEYVIACRYVKVKFIKYFYTVINTETISLNNLNSKNKYIEKDIILADKLPDIIFYSSDISPPTI